MLKNFLKLCSVVLTIALLVNMLPMQIFALELQATDTSLNLSAAYTDDANNYLQRLDYGNGDSVQYEYDD